MEKEQTVSEGNKEELKQGAEEEKETDSPRTTKINLENNELAQQEEEVLVEDEEKDAGSSQPTSTE